MHLNTPDHCTQIAPHKTLCLFTVDCGLDRRMKQLKAASFRVVQQAQGRQVALQQPKLLPGASFTRFLLQFPVGPKYNEPPHYNEPRHKKHHRKSYTERSGVYEGGV